VSQKQLTRNCKCVTLIALKTNAEEKDELNLVTLAQQYSDEDKARELLESLLWPDGPVCPHCQNHKEKAIKEYGHC
jgi:Transposase zinc-ribbon domain